MIQQRDALWWRRLNGAMRHALVRGVVPGAGGYVVAEYPKSGGSWMAQMLSDAMGLPFPRNRLPALRSNILHGHYLPRNVGRPSITIWRDGRDVMVSLYHHRVGANDYALDAVNARVRKALSIDDPADVKKYLPRFIEHLAAGETFPRYHWGHFVEAWQSSRTSHLPIRYEDMLKDSAAALAKAAAYLGHTLDEKNAVEVTERYSFVKQAGRERGSEDTRSYLRKGVAGDWQNAFTDETREVFKHFMGDALVEMGYETGKDW